MLRTIVAAETCEYNKRVKKMDDYEYELLNMSQEDMERIANGEDTDL